VTYSIAMTGTKQRIFVRYNAPTSDTLQREGVRERERERERERIFVRYNAPTSDILQSERESARARERGYSWDTRHPLLTRCYSSHFISIVSRARERERERERLNDAAADKIRKYRS
jgi:hypothetical protein